MKIKTTVFASLLASLGHKVTAELSIDDANGTTLTFPDISEISEINEGVSVDASDGTYTIANGDDALTIVVEAGKVTSISAEEPEFEASKEGEESEVSAELDEEVAQVLTVLGEQVVALKASNEKFVADLADLKKSLKHDTTEGKPKPDAKAGITNRFKITD